MAAEMVAAPRDSESGRELPGCRARLRRLRGTRRGHACQWAAELEDPGGPMMRFAAWSKKRLSDTSASEPQTEQEEPTRKKARQDESGEAKSKCAVCLTGAISCAFVPCGHMVCCMRCAVLVEPSGCPICREPIVMPLRIYS